MGDILDSYRGAASILKRTCGPRRVLSSAGLILILLATACTATPARSAGHHAYVTPNPTGTIIPAWQNRGHQGYTLTDAAYDSFQNLLVVLASRYDSSGDTISTLAVALNPATGNVVWRTATIPGLGPSSISTAGNIIALATATNNIQYISGDPNSVTLPIWTIDPKSGRILQEIPQSTGEFAGLSDGNVLVQRNRQLQAVSADTGMVEWSRALCASDSEFSPTADNDIIALSCPGVLLGLSPSDGHTEWKRPYKPDPSRPYSADQDIIEAPTLGSITFWNSKGEKVLTVPDWLPGPSGSQIPVPFYVTSSRIILVNQNSSNRLTITSFDRRDSRIQTRLTMPPGITPEGGVSCCFYRMSADYSGGVVYIPVSLPQMYLGDALLEANLNDGSWTLATVSPRIGIYSTVGAQSYTYKNVRYLLMPKGKTDALAAYRASPPVGQPIGDQGKLRLQGTRAHWPNACSLLPSQDRKLLLRNLGAGYITQSTTAPTDSGLPGASQCRYLPAGNFTGSVTISIVWDGTSKEATDAVLTDAYQDISIPMRHPPGDLAYSLANFQVYSDGITFAEADLIIQVYDTSIEPIAMELSRSIANKLQGSPAG